MSKNTAKSDTTIDWLNHLYAMLTYTSRGYRKASDVIEHKGLLTLFDDLATTYEAQSEVIAKEIHNLGGEVEEKKKLMAAILHGWLNIKASLMPNRELATLEELDDDNGNLLESYRKAIDSHEVEDSICKMLNEQHDRIFAYGQRIHTLRAAFDDTTTQEIKRELFGSYLPNDNDETDS